MSLSKRRPVGRPGREWTKEEVALLGTMVDRVVADRLGMSVMQIFLKRKKLGIQPFRRHLNRKTYPFAHLLGKVRDIEIARKYGLSRERIRQLRDQDGIILPEKWHVGDKIGQAIILGMEENIWRLRCACGGKFALRGSLSDIKNCVGVCRACKAKSRVAKNVGKTWNRLTAVKQVKNRYWQFYCACGTKSFEANINNVRRGFTKSCGCLLNEYFDRGRRGKIVRRKKPV